MIAKFLAVLCLIGLAQAGGWHGSRGYGGYGSSYGGYGGYGGYSGYSVAPSYSYAAAPISYSTYSSPIVSYSPLSYGGYSGYGGYGGYGGYSGYGGYGKSHGGWNRW